jgi:DNA-binding transcriptional regulator YiaG
MLKTSEIPESQYKSTKASRAQAKIIIDVAEGRRKDMPGFTTRIFVPPKEVKKARTSLKLTQKGFADLLKVQLITVQSWEQGLRSPDNTVAMLIQLLPGDKHLRKILETFGSPKRTAAA